MPSLIREAERYLPSDLPVGTIMKIPVNTQTGKYVESHQVNEDDPAIVYYGFIKDPDDWVYLGRGLTSL